MRVLSAGEGGPGRTSGHRGPIERRAMAPRRLRADAPAGSGLACGIAMRARKSRRRARLQPEAAPSVRGGRRSEAVHAQTFALPAARERRWRAGPQADRRTSFGARQDRPAAGASWASLKPASWRTSPRSDGWGSGRGAEARSRPGNAHSAPLSRGSS
jgi:hypothetical protein